jgi:tetratricopeptide (TPR) repeat protein
MRSNRREALKDFYAKILEQFPDNVDWNVRAAGFAADSGDMPKAEQLFSTAFQKSVENGKPDADALGMHLKVLLSQRKYDALFNEAQKYVDGNLAPVAYTRMAEAKAAIGDKVAAIQYFSKAIDKAGSYAAINAQIVRKLYAALGQNDAEKLCKQKLDENPDYDMAYWTMYNLQMLKGDYNKAIEYIDVCIKMTNQDKPAWVELLMKKAEVLGLAYITTSDKNYFRDIIKTYESLIAKMPNNTHVLNNFAYILAENDQDLEKALEYVKRANESVPNDPGYLDTYALVLYKLGRFAEAVGYSQASIQQYDVQQVPVTEDVYEHLGQIQEKLGKVPQARAAYEQAIEVGGESMPKPVRERLDAAIDRLGKVKDGESGQK